ncbi:PAS/PAC sensors-containing diguanylate cyclase/phosphodiesterase [Paramagnetospirillum caucaseum]|uniref:PAS/PAC sensors-containing diguanylate cyclase/phosphodiesterase n=1 Tax=Paramagnetospirillum caucaseum TaxID=1244869 RepID=M2Z5G5_9PROT|nr:EAL domain-containing protein [Paramagnetospirillum caucaseum]EME69555.1 PAS/PAC sensors-containing diguanylate cyclase/phosphodiesterase [Paramagnetospirillum caucaseum]
MNSLRLPSTNQRAVVIDDSASAVALMLQLLQTIEGCEPIGFTNSAEALRWCLANDIDLLIVDYEMPAPDGLAIIEAFRNDRGRAAIPVVMVTSTEDVDVRYMALQIGATDFLAKPIDHVEFAARMRNLLASCRAHKTLAEVSLWLTEEVRKTSMVVRQSPASVVITDSDGIIEYVNPKFTETTGYRPEEVIGQRPSLLKSGYSTPEMYRELWDTITGGNEWRGTFQNRRKDGSMLWEQALISPIRDETGAITNFVAIKEDITLRKEYEARLEWQANYDSLTGLPNRMLVLDRLGQAIALAGRNSDQVAVMLVDLDRFKAVNDTMGHDAGDEILRQVAQRLRIEQRQADTVARVGNDEFVMVLTDLGEAHAPQAVAARICARLEAPFQVGDAEIFISASIGIALFPENGSTAQDLLRSATAAMPVAETEGRGNWRFFTPELDASARKRLAIEASLRHALERGEFQVHYHPLVEVASGHILAAEALLRWTNPDLGPVAPDLFIPIAEETGLIVPIGAWVVETVCRDIARWAGQGLPPIRVAVNVSSRQLADRALLEVIARALAGQGVAAGLVEIEVTERLLLDQSPHTLTLLNDLKDMGLRFSIDDFGTGYSSMSYLTSFPFDVLKIDRSFISKVTERGQDKALTQAIIAMAHSLDLEVVAEGVETHAQLEFLRRSGCDFAQGYLFTRPVSAAAFAEVLNGGGKYTFAAMA